jgi:hypothetical protein
MGGGCRSFFSRFDDVFSILLAPLAADVQSFLGHNAGLRNQESRERPGTESE